MNKQRLLQLVLAMCIAGCSAPTMGANTGRAKPVPAVPAKPETPVNMGPFSYKVAAYAVAAKDDEATNPNESAALFNGNDFRFRKNQLIVSLKNEKALDKVIKHLNAKVIDQMKVPHGFKTTGNKVDGSAKLLPVESISTRPTYLLEVPVAETDDISEFDARAKRKGAGGELVFNSKKDASLFNKSLEVKEKFADDVVVSCVNTLYKAQNTTTEGLNPVTPSWGNYLAPGDPGFEYAGHFDLTRGNNFVDYYGTDIASAIADGTGVVVAVVDTGFQGASEPYLPSGIMRKMEWTWNTATDSSSIAGHEGDANKGHKYHGRRVSSLIFADYHDNQGTMGCASDAQPFLIHTSLAEWDVAEAISAAQDNGAKVVNISMSTPLLWYGYVQQAVADAVAANVIIVACTGNEGNQTTYPASLSGVLGVAATDYNGDNAGPGDPGWGPSGGSNTIGADLWACGTQVAVAVDPGTVASDNPNGTQWGVYFTQGSGTSFATPLVSGVIAGCVEKGWITSQDGGAYATTFMQVYGHTYNGRVNLDAIKALE